MTSRFVKALWGLAVLLLGHVRTAKAASYQLTAAGSGLTLTATLTGVADRSLPGAVLLTGGFGVANGQAVTLYLPSGTPARPEIVQFGAPQFTYETTYNYDNVLYISGHNGLALDEDGLLFSLSNDHLNLFAGGAYSFSNDETLFGFNSPLDSVRVSELPNVIMTSEPSSVALLSSGLVGLVGFIRSRRARNPSTGSRSNLRDS